MGLIETIMLYHMILRLVTLKPINHIFTTIQHDGLPNFVFKIHHQLDCKINLGQVVRTMADYIKTHSIGRCLIFLCSAFIQEVIELIY